ncbi:hypothetical protein AB0K48_07435 [Nonomuraea sp. NPDC055795]
MKATTLALAAALAAALVLTSSAAMAGDEEEADVDVGLAQLTYTNGLSVTFTDSYPSNDVGMTQTGRIDRAPLIARDEETDSFLQTYLKITPTTVAVPQRLVDDHGADPPPELRLRQITTSQVIAQGLTPPHSAVISGMAACNYYWYDWYDWHDAGFPGMPPHTYYASDFNSGKQRYSDSYVANCSPDLYPSYIYARHRIYYKNAWGNYKKHFDGKVPPWHHQAVEKGSIKRWRKVAYSDGWNSSANCGELGPAPCMYTREGRFHN